MGRDKSSKMKILVTGGAGFIGSHACEYFAKRGARVIAVDNLSRAKLMGKSRADTQHNWEYLARLPSLVRIKGDVGDFETVRKLAARVDAIIHTAAQTAVTTSVENPRADFHSNAIGTFNVLEAARLAKKPPAVVVCSTNKVYGDNVNQIKIKKLKTRYSFAPAIRNGVPESLGVDLCEHTPYGCSKLAADLYAQDYARLYGLKIGVFRMSCIYGTRQFGVEDQGWLAWFVIAAVTGRRLTIFGDGKQVRDCLWVDDLIRAYALFLKGKKRHAVLNVGGGPHNTLSLIELLSLLKSHGFQTKVRFAPWRPSDQRVFVSDIRLAKRVLSWKPVVSPTQGVLKLIRWVTENRRLFQ